MCDLPFRFRSAAPANEFERSNIVFYRNFLFDIYMCVHSIEGTKVLCFLFVCLLFAFLFQFMPIKGSLKHALAHSPQFTCYSNPSGALADRVISPREYICTQISFSIPPPPHCHFIYSILFRKYLLERKKRSNSGL